MCRGTSHAFLWPDDVLPMDPARVSCMCGALTMALDDAVAAVEVAELERMWALPGCAA